MAKDHIEIINLKKKVPPANGTLGQVLTKASNKSYDYVWQAIPAGVTTFLGLTDTPATYVGQALKMVRVNAGATALEFVTLSIDQTRINDGANTTYVDTDEVANIVKIKSANTGTNDILQVFEGTGTPVKVFHVDGNGEIKTNNSRVLYHKTSTLSFGLGLDSLSTAHVGGHNIAFGYYSGRAIFNGSGNILIGAYTGSYLSNGSNNTNVGYQAGRYGNYAYSVYIGYLAGLKSASNYATVLGCEASGNNGINPQPAVNAILIGYRAGYYQTTNSNKLRIDALDRGSAANEDSLNLINGTMAASPANQDLRINAKLCVNVAPLTNMVAGDAVLEGGSLIQKPITTPTADAGYFKIYGKADDKTYYQDTVGTEHEVVPLDLLPGYIIAYS